MSSDPSSITCRDSYMIVKRVAGTLLVFAVAACTSMEQRRMDFVEDRGEKLKPLTTWHPTWCRVEAKLTQPALARYKEMLKNDKLSDDTLVYTWKARKNICEILPLQQSELVKNHRAFLETAMCMLLQVY